jgi:hypothetical protein
MCNIGELAELFMFRLVSEAFKRKMMETAAENGTLHHRPESNPTLKKTLSAFLGNLCRPIAAPNVNRTSTSSKGGKENKCREHFHMSAGCGDIQIKSDLQQNRARVGGFHSPGTEWNQKLAIQMIDQLEPSLYRPICRRLS